MKFIGMDVHSRQCTFVIKGKSGRVLQTASIKTQEKDLVSFIRTVRGPKKLAFEEGALAQWLYVILKDEVDEIVVCIPTKKKGPKTDVIDATELAELLRTGALKSVFHVDNELIRLRVLISGYDDVMQEIVRTKNRYKAIFRRVGLPAEKKSFYKNKEWISSLETEDQRFVATALFKQIELLESQKLEYLTRFEANVKKYKPVKLLASIPGIAAVRANQIVGIMVTPYRFPNKYHLFSYAMLTNHNLISDGKLYGKKRAHGRAELKTVFKSSFLSATQSDTSFRRKYEKMRAEGKDDRAARNAVAKQIAATVFGVWKSGKKYNDKYEEVTRRQQASTQNNT